MADIAFLTADKIDIVESQEQMTLPAAEAITAGYAVRLDTSTGKFTKAKATTSAEARVYGIATKTVAAGEALTAIRRGVFDGFNVAAVAFDADLYLSDTDGRVADAAGTVSFQIGRVIPAHAQSVAVALDKLVLIDMASPIELGATKIVTSELLAASVDKMIFVADKPYRVVSVNEVHSVIGGSGATVAPRKITADSVAPGASAGATCKELLATPAIGLETTLLTMVTPALSSTASDYALAAGDRLALNFSGTLTGLVGHISIALIEI